MSDTSRLPRIGEIWAEKKSGKRVLVLNANDAYADLYTDALKIAWLPCHTFVKTYKPVGEYDLDPLVLALKGDRT